MPRHEAILEANHTRLRPILMTTVMLVAAMVPIALGQGPGAGARASMAKVIIGGQMLSLVLALLVTPVFYALLDMVGQPRATAGHPLLGRAVPASLGTSPPRAHNQRRTQRARCGNQGRRAVRLSRPGGLRSFGSGERVMGYGDFTLDYLLSQFDLTLVQAPLFVQINRSSRVRGSTTRSRKAGRSPSTARNRGVNSSSLPFS